MKNSKIILKNAQSLLSTSLSLLAIGQKHHAAHFAALCLEECSKCLMHLESVRNIFEGSDRNHYKKEKLIGFFHFLAGMLSTTYIVKVTFDSGFLGEDENSHKVILDELLKFSGMKGIGGLTECIKSYLESQEQYKENQNTFTVNEIRKNTVYVDVVDGFLQTPQKRVASDAIKEIINDARFAVSLLNMVLYKNFSWIEFLETFPGKQMNPELEAKKFLKSLKEKL